MPSVELRRLTRNCLDCSVPISRNALRCASCAQTLRHNPTRRVSDHVDDRFLKKVNKSSDPDGCWLWTASLSRFGHGRFIVDGINKMAHRVSYERFNGTIPDGLCVLHRCDVPNCVNPAHLFLGTRQENNLDKLKKGRAASRLTADDVRAIRDRYATGDVTQRQLAVEFGCTFGLISKVVRNEIWRLVE